MLGEVVWLVGSGLGWGHSRGAGSQAIVQPELEPRIWVPGSLEGRRGGALREAPPTPPTPPRPGRVDPGRSGSRDLGPSAIAYPTVCFWGVKFVVLGPLRFGEPVTGELTPAAPSPRPRRPLDSGSRSLGARPAPAPHRPRAQPPGAQAGPCAGCPQPRGIVEGAPQQNCSPGRAPPERPGFKIPPVLLPVSGWRFGVPALRSVSLAPKGAGFRAFSSPHFLRALA